MKLRRFIRVILTSCTKNSVTVPYLPKRGAEALYEVPRAGVLRIPINGLSQDQTNMSCKVPEIGVPGDEGHLVIKTGLRN